VANLAHLDDLLPETPDYSTHRDFEWVAIEHKLEGNAVEAGDTSGWAFHELDRIDAARGGATPAEIDALRLMAVFLAHWDNKSDNQRLLCRPAPNATHPCARPLAMLQDVGATFGPRKVDLPAWRDAPIWADATGCRVSMADMPHDGSTFPRDVHISEGGRRLLAARLAALPLPQVEALFAASRFPAPVHDWTNVYQEKVTRIAGRTCPTA
jgi:hypothetical protein